MSTLPYPQRIVDPHVNRELRNMIDATNALKLQIDAIRGVSATAALTGGNFVIAASDNTIKDAGFSPGITGTVTLAKITGGGTNGSLTFKNGLITEVIQPT